MKNRRELLAGVFGLAAAPVVAAVPDRARDDSGRVRRIPVVTGFDPEDASLTVNLLHFDNTGRLVKVS